MHILTFTSGLMDHNLRFGPSQISLVTTDELMVLISKIDFSKSMLLITHMRQNIVWK